MRVIATIRDIETRRIDAEAPIYEAARDAARAQVPDEPPSNSRVISHVQSIRVLLSSVPAGAS